MAEDLNKTLKDLISSLRGGEDAPPGAAPLLNPPAPPPADPRGARGGDAELREALRRAAVAEAKLAAGEAARREADEQVKESLAAMRRIQEDSHSKGRIESLEARLDAMGERLLGAVDKQGVPERIAERLSELTGRLDAVVAHHEQESLRFTALRADIRKLLERFDEPPHGIEESRRGLLEASERIEKSLCRLESGLQEHVAKAIESFAAARSAAEEAAKALGSLPARREAVSASAELLEHQRKTEEKLERALAALRSKDEILSRLSKEFTEKLKGQGG